MPFLSRQKGNKLLLTVRKPLGRHHIPENFINTSEKCETYENDNNKAQFIYQKR